MTTLLKYNDNWDDCGKCKKDKKKTCDKQDYKYPNLYDVGINEYVYPYYNYPVATIKKALCEEWDWATYVSMKNFSDTNFNYDLPLSPLAVNNCGEIYLSGFGTSGTTSGPTFPTFRSTNNSSINGIASSSSQAFVSKLSPQGIFEWVATVINPSGFNVSSYSAVSSSGYVYNTGQGYCNGNNIFLYHNDGSFYRQGNRNGNLSWTAKVSPQGRWSWLSEIVTSTGTKIESPIVISNSSQCIYYSAYTESGTTAAVFNFYNSNSSVTTLSSHTLQNEKTTCVVAKQSSSGLWLWSAEIMTDESNVHIDQIRLSEIATDIYIAVSFSGLYNDTNKNITLINSDGTIFGSYPVTNMSGFVAKIDSRGTWKWLSKLTLNTQKLKLEITSDKDDSLFVSAFISSNTIVSYYNAGNSLSSALSSSSPANTNMLYVTKLSSQGEWLWLSSVLDVLPSVNPQQIVGSCSSITCDKYKNVFVSCKFNGGYSNFRSSDNSFMSTNPYGVVNAGLFVAKLSSEGYWTWVTYIRNEINQFAYPCLANDGDGNNYLSLWSTSSCTHNFHERLTLSVPSTSITVGKIANDIASQEKIGVVQDISYGQARVSWEEYTSVSTPVVPGINHYLLTTYSTDTKLVSDDCNLCRPNRYVGFGYDNTKLFWKSDI